jgi:carbon monoxide dehydrogenase subunit G
MLPLFLVLAALIVVLYIAFDLVRVPVETANSVSIERPLTQVFAFVTDPENIPQWNPRVRSVRLLSPSLSGQDRDGISTLAQSRCTTR